MRIPFRLSLVLLAGPLAAIANPSFAGTPSEATDRLVQRLDSRERAAEARQTAREARERRSAVGPDRAEADASLRQVGDKPCKKPRARPQE